jgi:LeuA allosteric (dimerisation) domain
MWTLDSVHVFTGTEAKPTATVTLRNKKGIEKSTSALGCGPIDAVYNAVRSIVGRPNDLIDFSIKVCKISKPQNATFSFLQLLWFFFFFFFFFLLDSPLQMVRMHLVKSQ